MNDYLLSSISSVQFTFYQFLLFCVCISICCKSPFLSFRNEKKIEKKLWSIELDKVHKVWYFTQKNRQKQNIFIEFVNFYKQKHNLFLYLYLKKYHGYHESWSSTFHDHLAHASPLNLSNQKKRRKRCHTNLWIF